MSVPVHGPFLTLDPGDYSDVVIRIVEGLAQDIDEFAGLDPHQTIRFKRPAVVLPSDCPLLCVWLLEEEYQNSGSFRLEEGIALGISWQEAVTEKARTLIDDPESAKSQLVAIAKIKARVRKMGALVGNPSDDVYLPGVPEVDFVIPVRTDYVPATETVDTGLVEGYAMTVRVFVRE